MKMTFAVSLKYLRFLIIIFFVSSCTNKKEFIIEITNLRCELITNPEGIDISAPRLSWELQCKEESVLQKSYQILVSSSLEKLNANKADIWDSKQINSDESVFIAYNGQKLQSSTEYYWKVRVITNKGKSGWSKPARWSMGLMTPEEWKSKWIGLDKSFEWESPTADRTRMGARYFRKEFKTPQPPQKATLYICGLGLYKLHINGNVIGEQELSPTPTDYRKEVKYNTFDVTQNIQKGSNAIGVILGNGRFFHMRKSIPYQYPKMIFQMELEYSDGSRQIVTSDESWKVTADGPIRANNEYDGEEYDARKEMPGWDKPGFHEDMWNTAELVEPPKGKLSAQLNQNIKVMDTINPVSIKELKKGTYILDMGQNMVGWLRLRVKGNKGDIVQLRFAEFLNEDGTINQENLRGGLATDKYTLQGNNEEEWEPCFTYHGFRFVEITGYPGIPVIDDFQGCVVYDEMEQTGTFETSNALVNQIYKNAYWSIRGNYRGMPTDCPQRTERMGWTGDRAIGSYGESFIFNNNNLYAKWVNDIRITQLESGSISDIAPSYWSKFTDNMTWPGTYLTVSNMLYDQFGNKKPIVRHYDSMKKWLYYMRDKYMTPDHLMPRDEYGDWCTPPEDPTFNDPKDPGLITDKVLIGTAYYYHMLQLLEKFAYLLEKPEDAKEFEKQAVVLKEAYNDNFLNKENGYYSNNTVTANLLSLSFDLVPENDKKVVFESIVNRTMNKFDGHVSTGIIGNQWLMRGLTDNGRPDIAYQMILKTDYPSYGYMIDNGATTIWEHWNGDKMAKWIDSQNHVMQLGDLLLWYYENLAGIRNAPGSSGFKQIMMKPEIIDGLNSVNASYHSVKGLIKSSWKKDDSTFQWNITIPCNTIATVYIPATSESSVLEDKQKLSGNSVKFQKMEGQYAVFEVGSGNYSFSVNF